MKTRPRLCLLEDDPIMGESLSFRFELEGFACDWYQNASDALDRIGQVDYAALISDIRLPDMRGDELFDRLLAAGVTLPPTIFITGFGSIADAVALVKKGAIDYITKPFDLDTLVEKLRSVSTVELADAAGESPPVLGVSAEMREVERTLRRLAGHNSTVLITGESGVGKEHAARYLHLHAYGGDDARPFVAVNCGAIPEGLMEAELFGHEKGAFTGALRTRKGLFEQAAGGTLFLDEIGEMPHSMQVRLLRVLQDRRVVRVGAEESIPTDVRIVCATHRDLAAMVRDGGFREDLYYRINVVHVELPPLRKRRDDILWFVHRFLSDLARERPDLADRYLLPSAEAWMLRQPWVGNLRELKHRLERACILTSEPGLGAESFLADDDSGAAGDECGDLRARITRFERQVILEALAQHEYQITRTARELGISRKNLWEKMRKLGIEREETGE